MLGSVAEAEDVVQEALLRAAPAARGGRADRLARAFVSTVTARLALNRCAPPASAGSGYVGDWLPEPLITDGGATRPASRDRRRALAGLLVVLETLWPEQRAVLLLHDVFDYGYGEVADIVGKSEANARQLAPGPAASPERRPRFQTSREQRDKLTWRFFAAAALGDLAGARGAARARRRAQRRRRGKVPALGPSLRGRGRVARATVALGGRVRAGPARRCGWSRSTASPARSCSPGGSG